MKLPVEWLEEWVELPEDFVDVLDNLGIGVEGYGDGVLDLEITPNRPDLLSVIGIAREIAGKTGKPLKKNIEAVFPVRNVFPVEVEDKEGCPRYTLGLIKGVKVGPSPEWMARRLELAGINPINNVVDATNYVMLELGQPLHPFDREKVKGKIVVRRARDGEKITTLDGVERELNPEILVIADAERPVALAGIMGAEDSGIDEETRDVLLESAYFDPIRVRRGRKILNISTEASYRFERGGDVYVVPVALRRALELIREVAGGEVVEGMEDTLPEPEGRKPVKISISFGKRLLGIEIKDEDVKDWLEPFGFRVEDGKVIPPRWRRDIHEEVDVWEEVARIYGYERVPSSVRIISSEPVYDNGKILRQAKRVLSGLGLFEVYPIPFMNPEDVAFLPEEDERRKGRRLKNPMWPEKNVMRTTLIPGLLSVARYNLNHQIRDIRIFEAGKVFLSEERIKIAGLFVGEEKKTWYSGRKYDFYDVKGAVEEFLTLMRIPFELRDEKDPLFEEGACLGIWVNERCYGYLGEIKRELVERYEIEHAYGFELDASLLELREPEEFVPLPRFPHIKRDLSFLVPAGKRCEDVLRVIREATYLERVEVIDIYRGKNIPEGYTSMTFSCVFRHPERTLTDDEVEHEVQEIIRKLEDEGIQLRRQ